MFLAGIRSKLWAAGLALAVLAAWAYLGHIERTAHKAGDTAGYARGHAEYLELLARVAESARLAEAAERLKETRRTAAVQEAIDAKDLELQRLRADRAIADAAAGRLQQRVTALIAAARSSSAGGHPQAAASGPPAEDALGMLADVHSRCVARVRLLADLADQRGAAGAACERIHDAMTEETTP